MSDPPRVDRRRFLESAAALAAASWLHGCTEPFGPESPGRLRGGGASRRVVVVGAGMAGLVAAYELERAGHWVTVLEARDREGGRVLTLRTPFADGHFAEAGAARIRPEHDLTLAYAAWFGLELAPFYPRAGDYVELFGGQRVRRGPDAFRSVRPDYVKLAAGSEALPRAFASEFGGVMRLGEAVTRIEHGGGGARVETSRGRVVDADRVLVTAPLPVLPRISFAPRLSTGKDAAMGGGFSYQAATRVFVRCRSRFWEADGFNGWGVTDWPEELWHPTWDMPGPEGVLMTYVRGDLARELDAVDHDARVSRVLAHWEDVLPGVTQEAVGSISHSWQLDEWSGAAWAAPTASEHATFSDEIARPEGVLHFAGEHASSDRGWMQGALASGLRAAREIDEA